MDRTEFGRWVLEPRPFGSMGSTNVTEMGATPDPNATTRSGRSIRILALLAVAALLVNFVETMLVPDLGELQSFFGGAPVSSIAWVITAYLVVGVCTIPIFGKLGDIYGKRTILGVVLTIYAVAVALAPLTPDIAPYFGVDRVGALNLLIAVRGLQGVGLAMFPLALAMVADALPRERVASAQGLIASMFAIGAALGLVVGSWLIETAGWQVAYVSVVPFAVLLTILTVTWLPEGQRGTGVGLDLLGAGLLGGGLAAFLLGLTFGPTWGWSTLSGGAVGAVSIGVPELFAIAVVLTLLFIWRERATPEPLIDLHRFATRNIALAYTGALLVGTALFLGFVALSILVTTGAGLNMSPIAFGIASIPTTISMFVAAPLAGVAIARIGPRPMILSGATLSTAGFLLLLAYHGVYLDLVVEAVPTFVGLIIVLVSVTNVIALSSHKGETGIHMGMTEMFQDLGASIGPVLVSTFLTTFTRIVLVPSTGGPVETVIPADIGFTYLFMVGAILAVLLGIIGLFVENYRVADSAVGPSSRSTHSPVETG